MPQSQRAQVQFWMALCGPPAPSPDGDLVMVGSMPSATVRAGGEDGTDCIPWNPQHSERPTPAIVFLPFSPSRLSEAQGFDVVMLMSSLETSCPA